MKLTTNTILIIFGILAILVMSCAALAFMALPLVKASRGPAADFPPTAQVMLTPVTVPPTMPVPVQTQAPAIPTPIPPASTAIPTATVITYCDWAIFIKDVTVPDGTTFSPGDIFVKTWRLKNRGTCTWSPDYMLAFNSGDRMGDTNAVRLPEYVAPGQSVDVSVTLTAPAAPGEHVGYWMLRNPTGVLFGSGDKANTPFYVDITTRAPLPHGTVTGNICYPSEFNPPLTIYFERADNTDVIQFAVPENHMNFSFLLPNGKYYARAWAPNYNLEGAYVNPDLTMKSFIVSGGQTTSGIGICDWGVTPHSRGQ
ncbi:MAG TPA: NBR1-Ig-like domain-containing protein [Anaerolineales bacterium]|jgi:hypothetical protein